LHHDLPHRPLTQVTHSDLCPPRSHGHEAARAHHVTLLHRAPPQRGTDAGELLPSCWAPSYRKTQNTISILSQPSIPSSTYPPNNYPS
jgi:hypothetical protein